jgi:hypothetical protein
MLTSLFLRQGNEVVRPDHADAGLVPARQAFETYQGPIVAGDFGLVMHLYMAVAQGLVEGLLGHLEFGAGARVGGDGGVLAGAVAVALQQLAQLTGCKGFAQGTQYIQTVLRRRSRRRLQYARAQTAADDDRGFGFLCRQVLEGLNAIHLGHLQVDQQMGGMPGLQVVQIFTMCGGGTSFEADLLGYGTNGETDIGIVVHRQ